MMKLHYDRRWKEKDLKDLKTLIKLTIHFIEAELTARDWDLPTFGESSSLVKNPHDGKSKN